MKNAANIATMMLFGFILAGREGFDNPFGSERSVQDNAKYITLKCVNGYVFTVYSEYNSGSLTQVGKIGEDGLPRPQLCPPSTDTKKLIWE